MIQDNFGLKEKISEFNKVLERYPYGVDVIGSFVQEVKMHNMTSEKQLDCNDVVLFELFIKHLYEMCCATGKNNYILALLMASSQKK